MSGLKFTDMPVFLSHTFSGELGSIGREPVRFLNLYLQRGVTVSCLVESDVNAMSLHRYCENECSMNAEYESCQALRTQFDMAKLDPALLRNCVLWTFKRSDLDIFCEGYPNEEQTQSEKEYWQKIFATLAWQLPIVSGDDEDNVQTKDKLQQMSYIAIEENNSVLFRLREEKFGGEEE